jgi:IclR family pca regulon transcriptional regulator
MRLTDLAKELGVERATLFRYCATLVELGYLTVDPRTKEYALGPRARAMAYAATAHSPSLTIIREELPVLANRFRGAASLGLLDGSQVLYIERAVAGQALNFQIAVGDRLPAAITSIGKALLATRLDSEVEALLGVQMGRAALDRLLSELATVRVEKMAFNIGGFQAGLNSVAVAVYEIGSNVPLGAINLAGAATSLGYERLRDEVAPALTAFSGELAAGSVAPE